MVNPFLYVFTGIYDYQLRWGKPHSRARNIAAMGTILPVNFIVLSICLVIASILDIDILEVMKNTGYQYDIPYEAVWVGFVVPISLLIVYATCIKGGLYLSYYKSTFNARYVLIKSLVITLSCLFLSFLCMYVFG